MPNLYKLQNDAKPGELGGPPLIIGSALRFPSCAYQKWGISGNPQDLRELSLSAYQDEFADTSPAWMASVVEAANRGGIGDRPNMLRNAVGKAAAYLTYNLLKTKPNVKVTDVGCGAGGSLAAYFTELSKLVTDYADRVEITLVDLSRNNLWKANDVAQEKGFQHVHPVHSRDIEMDSHIAEPQDIVINVAGIHANSDIRLPIQAVTRILAPKGYFVSGDWHHARWLHPTYTYRMFDKVDPKGFDWKNKGEFMDEFARVFPSCKEEPLAIEDDADRNAVDEIESYWMNGWATVRYENLYKSLKRKLNFLNMARFDHNQDVDVLPDNYFLTAFEKIEAEEFRPTDEQIMSEGHVPVAHYLDACKKYGLFLDDSIVSDGILQTNPLRVVPDTTLNIVFVAQKTSPKR